MKVFADFVSSGIHFPLSENASQSLTPHGVIHLTKVQTEAILCFLGNFLLIGTVPQYFDDGQSNRPIPESVFCRHQSAGFFQLEPS